MPRVGAVVARLPVGAKVVASREGANVGRLLVGVVVVVVVSREGAKVETSRIVGAKEGALVGPFVVASVGAEVETRRMVGTKEGALVVS